MTQKSDKSITSINNTSMMKRFIMIFMVTVLAGLGLPWLVCRYEKKIFISPSMSLPEAHLEMEKKCDVGQLTIVGDSTATADYLPEEIGPNVRLFGVGGGNPVETFYIVKDIIDTCSHLPKAMILSFTPYNLSTMETGEMADLMWSQFVPWHVISRSDTLDALRTMRENKDTQVFGQKSLFDIDAKMKILLYNNSFPTYYFSSLISYFNENVSVYNFYGRENKRKELYKNILTDNGHEFFGQEVKSHMFDHESDMSKYIIEKNSDQYLKKTASLLKEHGVHVYFAAPPHNAESVAKYHTDVIKKYVAYLQDGARAGDWKILGKPFREIPPVGMGDYGHLNFHGAFWYSYDIRQALLDTQDADLVWTEQEIAPNNLYIPAALNIGIWKKTTPDDRMKMSITSDAMVPQTAYSMAVPVVSLSIRSDKPEYGSISSSINSDRSPVLEQDSYYVGSIFIKNSTAKSVTWHLVFPGRFDGSVTWNFEREKIYWNGEANQYNSGVEDCGKGWMRLWLRGKTPQGKEITEYSHLSFYGTDDPEIKLYGASIERSLLPRNDCKIN